MSNEIIVKSLANGVAEIKPIILKESHMIRLIFHPFIVEQGKGSNVKGYILYQKKGKNDKWEDYKEIELNNLKKGEYVKIELDSNSVKILLENIEIIQNLYRKYGIRFGEHKYYINDENLNDIINQISKFGDKNKLIGALEKLESSDIENINNLVNISGFKKILNEWEDNKDNSKEEYWQAFFTKHVWILSQVFSKPYIFLDDKPYLGGKQINNRGGSNGDYIYTNLLTGNIAFIEIKTPKLDLLKSNYGRNGGIYKINDELTGGINQVLTQKDTFLKDFGNKKGSPESYGSKCILIVGDSSELDNKDKIKSFELFRGNLKDVDIITFDELFVKIKKLLDVFNGVNEIEEKNEEIYDIPF